MLRYSREKLTAQRRPAYVSTKTISTDISGRFYEKRKWMHGYFSLEHIRYWIFYIESFLFLVWVFVPLQNKILLFKVKFHMYMCSLVCIIMRILISCVDVYLCVICFFKVYRYLTWCNNVFSFIFCYCCNQLNTSQSVSQILELWVNSIC